MLAVVDKGSSVEFNSSVRIERSARDVFAMLVDVQDWATGPGSPVVVMEKLPPGPTTVGTRWREVIDLGVGLTMTMWSEVSALKPDALLELRFWGGHMRGSLIYTLTAGDGYTVLHQHETMVPVGILRSLGWPIGLLLRRRLSLRLLDIRDELERAGHRE